MSKKLTKFQLLQFASSVFLCEELPDDWDDLTEDQQADFLENNVWEPMKNYSADEIYELVEDHASYLERRLKQWGLIDAIKS